MKQTKLKKQKWEKIKANMKRKPEKQKLERNMKEGINVNERLLTFIH